MKSLNINRNSESSLLNAVNTRFNGNFKKWIKVKIRNTRFPVVDNKSAFLHGFVEKADSNNPWFNKMFDFILNFLDSEPRIEDINQAIAKRKEERVYEFEKALEFKNIMKKGNMETLMAQGVRLPYINKERVMEEIEIIDKLAGRGL